MELKITDLRKRFFRVTEKVWIGGLLIVNPGKTDRDGNVLVPLKTISPDENGIVVTNDPEVIAYVKTPHEPSFFFNGKLNELFIGVSEFDNAKTEKGDFLLKDYYKVNIEEHKKAIEEAEEQNLYFFDKSLSLNAIETSINSRIKELELKKKQAQYIIESEEVKALEEKAAAIIKKRSSKSSS